MSFDRFGIRTDASLEFIPELLRQGGYHDFQVVHRDPDLLISETVPREGRMFIVIWDRHDVGKINALMSRTNTVGRYLRGFFLKNEVMRDPAPLIEAVREAGDEFATRFQLKEKSERIMGDKTFIEVGSLVKVSEKNGQELEQEYGSRRFTTLFIDKPMLRLMHQLDAILREMDPQIAKFRNNYKSDIDEINKTRGIKKKEDEFDDVLVKKLWEQKNTVPVKLDPILLTGETGVGKTLIVRWIKKNASFPGQFEEINASGLQETLLESELFGHTKGAWTDAKTTKPGKALLALGGVLFLDEIGDMPLEIQPKVMKFVEEKVFSPEGWTGSHFYTPLLVVGATNKDLEKEVAEGRFRQDFYARFKHRVHVPSIEERKQSLNSIIDLILQDTIINPIRTDGSRGRRIRYVSHEALEKFKNITYAENFRGLERIVRDAAYKTMDYGLDIILQEMIETTR